MVVGDTSHSAGRGGLFREEVTNVREPARGLHSRASVVVDAARRRRRT